MRRVPDETLQPWVPPKYSVDADGKVEGARPGPFHNWDRWGPTDQLGTANLCTPQRVVQAAACIRTGRRFSLGLPIGERAPSWRPEPLRFVQRSTSDSILGVDDEYWSDDWIVMALQASTQIDALCHQSAQHSMYNGFWSGLTTASTGARRLGIHNLADGIVGRAVLLDVARASGVEVIEANDIIDADRLLATATKQGTEIQPGDVLLVRTGFLNDAITGKRWTAGGPEPGVHPSVASLLKEYDVVMLATDTTLVEVHPSPKGVRNLHLAALCDLGMPLGELFDLDALAVDCACDGVYAGFFVAMPMPVVNGVGSPLNPLVIK